MPHTGPHPKPLQQATADPHLHRRFYNTKRQVWLSLCGVSWYTQGFVSALWMSLVGIRFDFKCNFTLLPSHWGFCPVLGRGIDFFGGANILLSLIIQQGVITLDAVTLFVFFFFFFLIFSLKLALSLYSFILIRGSLAHSTCPLPLNTHTYC